MPLSIQLFRTSPDLVRESQRRRFASVEIVDEIIAKDELWRRTTGDIDNLRKSRNAVQKTVGQKKKAGEECDDLVAEVKKLGEDIEAAELAQKELKVEVDKLIGKVGNIVDMGVPVSQDEDAHNEVVRQWGTPRDPAGLLNHHDLLWRIGGYEPERGVGVAGHRAYFLRDVGVLLNQAFINYGAAFLRKRQYTLLQPPYFMKKEVMAGVAQLEQFDEELYKVGGDGDDKYLIATSEQPICGYHMNEWLDEKTLPLRYGGISTCFRKEAGSHGKDTWGIFRVHQFEKVEQFVIVEGDLEKSKIMQDEMIAAAEEFYQSLGFPYHVISIVTGALNNAAIKKLDLECWFPGYNAYRELVSCSNCTDYQSRSMEIRSGGKKLGDREKKYVHMLNATLCATGRAICCLLETYQEPNGVRIPPVLVPFMGGIDFLPFVRDSKLPDKGDDKPMAKTAAASDAVAAPTAAPSIPVASPGPAVAAVSPEVAQLTAAVTEQGERVRVAKANKISKEDVQVLVDELVALKEKLRIASGSAAAPTSAPKADKKAEKKEKAVSATVPAPTPAPAPAPAHVHQPLVRPSYVTAGPRVAATEARAADQVPPLGAVLKDEDADLAALEARLQVFSYAAGYTPSKADNVLFDIVSAKGGLRLPNTARWIRHVNSFTDAEREAWV